MAQAELARAQGLFYFGALKQAQVFADARASRPATRLAGLGSNA